MYFPGVLCLLSAAVALPTPEQLHTNLPAILPPPELKPEENDSAEQVIVDPPAPISEKAIKELDKSDESKNLLESAEKIKEDNDKAQDKPQSKEWKESKESKDFKEKSKESKESKDLNDQTEIRPEEPQEEKKEKDSKSEQSKKPFDEDVPIIIEVVKGSKGFIPDWITSFFQYVPEIQWPFIQSVGVSEW